METEVSIVTVTPEMATKWLSENRYEFQRDVRNSQVKFLAEEIQRGTFKQDTVIEFCSVNGDTWLTDGQHRLSALVWAKTPQRFVVVRRYLKDETAAALDYTRTDQVIVRSTADTYKTLSLETELGLTPTHVNALGAAVHLIYRKFSGKTQRMHPDDRLRMMREYNDALGMYLETIAGARKELRHRLDRAAGGQTNVLHRVQAPVTAAQTQTGEVLGGDMRKSERLAELEARVARLEDIAEQDADAQFNAECAEMAEHAPTVPPPPTVGDDYHFFLRTTGFADHPCLWRAFLAGRMTA